MLLRPLRVFGIWENGKVLRVYDGPVQKIRRHQKVHVCCAGRYSRQQEFSMLVAAGRAACAPTQVPRGSLPKTSSRWDSGKGRNPHKNRMRVATTDDSRRSWDNSSFLTRNAAPTARLTGQNVRGHSQLKLKKVVQFVLRPSHGVHRVGTPGAGPRRVAHVS